MKNWFLQLPETMNRQPRSGHVFARQFWDNTLRTKLTILFFAVSIVPLAILTLINYLNNRAILINTANDGLSTAASSTASQLDGYFTQKLNTVSSEAQLPNIVDYLSLSSSVKVGGVDYIAIQEFIRILAQQDPNYIRSIAILDVRGKVMVDTNSGNINADMSDASYFQAVMKTGLRHVSSLEFDPQSGAPYLYFAAPVRDASGAIIGVLSKQYNASVLQASIAKNTGLAGEESYPILLDQNHLRLADGFDAALAYKTLAPLEPQRVAELQAKRLLPPVDANELSTNLIDFDTKLNQVDTQPFFSAEIHAAALDEEQIATANMTTQPWVVVFAQSKKVFLEPITMQARNNIIIMTLLGILAAVLGFFVSQTVASPIIRLTETAEAIHEGNLTLSAEVESKDEIGMLAIAFNDMTRQLRDFINSLEKRVADRTAAAENARAESESARKDLEAQVWLATGQTQLADMMRGEQNIPNLAENLISLVCRYTGAQAGALYLLNGKTLTLAGSYAFVVRTGFDGVFEIGEGLVGQAAINGSLTYFDDIPSDALEISTGLANIKPRQVAAVPFSTNGEVVGVIELATLSEFTPLHLELWNRVSESIGVAFRAVQTRQRLADLLMESQQQAEELQAQEEELRAANEELHAQAENLLVKRQRA